MDEKFLGKITNAEFGLYADRPFLMGLQLSFQFDGSGCTDGGKYTENISPECRWEKSERLEAIARMVERIDSILKDAKVEHVSELKGKPVEVTVKNYTFYDFRILTEVI